MLAVIDSELDGWRLVRALGAVIEEGFAASGASRTSEISGRLTIIQYSYHWRPNNRDSYHLRNSLVLTTLDTTNVFATWLTMLHLPYLLPWHDSFPSCLTLLILIEPH